MGTGWRLKTPPSQRSMSEPIGLHSITAYDAWSGKACFGVRGMECHPSSVGPEIVDSFLLKTTAPPRTTFHTL